MPSLDTKLGLAVGSYVGLLVAFGVGLVVDAGVFDPTVQATGLLSCLLVGGVFASRPSLASPVVERHVLSAVLGLHVGGILALLALAGNDEATGAHPLVFPFIVSALVGLVAFVLVRDRHVETVFGGKVARVSWYGGPHPRTVRRMRIVAVLAGVTVIGAPLAGVAVIPHRATWIESTRAWTLLAEVGPTIVGGVLGASIGTFLMPDRERRFTVYDGGIVVQNGRSGLRSRLSWWYVRGYELTDRELVVHTWFPLQAYRFDRDHFEQPDRVADILAEYAPEREATWL
ncbi:hypothetical protein [Haloarchaeobius iranensis]|uniref:Uncharacterized protein n=1 Tax=Haloarchaeobius iranensis TaxID=996166 RepID=A0A1G9W3T8_9EURY|nr:hypothetical protein [Haloarchaeobius iranensis]SDM79208.1 hypothetical protein SAMN05192554_107141 [Haloarchaeobius iranensis]